MFSLNKQYKESVSHSKLKTTGVDKAISAGFSESKVPNNRMETTLLTNKKKIDNPKMKANLFLFSLNQLNSL
jgi:hypothetical protein